MKGGRANFYGGVDPSNFLSNYLLISAPFGVKKVLQYALHNIPSC